MKNIIQGLRMNNLFSGFIVAVVAFPLCIAFAIASGVNPIGGIVTGVLGGFIAAAAGSSRFQVSGPAAAFITIIFEIVTRDGPMVLLGATFVGGLVLLLVALLRLGRLMELMPSSIVVGFTTGIGVLILFGQIPVALGIHAQGHDVLEKLAYTASHLSEARWAEATVLGITLAAALGWARLPWARWVPAPLVALLVGTAGALLLAEQGATVATIGALYDVSIDAVALSYDFLAHIPGELEAVLTAGVTLGLLVAVESLLASKALDGMGGGSHDPDRELIGLGLANLAVPFFGGLPASGVIVRGSTNVMSGATHKTSAMAHSLFLAAFVLVLFAYIKLLPMAALAAVLVLTARRLIEVGEIRRIARIDRWEAALAALTTALTVAIDLTVSVPLGVVLLLLVVLRRMLDDTRIDVWESADHHVVSVGSSVSFLTVPAVRRELGRLLQDPQVRALSLLDSRFVDATGVDMLTQLLARHPHLQLWVEHATLARKFEHAGLAVARIRQVGNRRIDLQRVFRHLGEGVTTRG